MGCLKKIFNMLILSFAVIGFVSVDGPEWVCKNFPKLFENKVSLDKVSDIGNFSKLDSEFEIDKSMNFFGYKGILAEHNISGQKFIILDTKNSILTESDINSPELEDKILSLAKQQRRNSIVPSEFEVLSRGRIYTYGKNVPYAKFSAKVKKLPMGNLNGMIAVVEDNDNTSKILISVNQQDKYSQLISRQFFNQITK